LARPSGARPPARLSAIDRLRAGLDVFDADWDRLYPKAARGPSRLHFTPVAVARRAAEWLVTRPGTRVLDVGAGVGKFCLVGALVSEGVFTGVEQRPHFVEIAREVADRGKIPRCRFVAGDVTTIDWRAFDAFYLYNPFAEHRLGFPPIDGTIERAPERHRALVASVEEALAQLPCGARAVTFHGFGGALPPGWEVVRSEVQRGGALELWEKTL
jgi:SAM-dependent methyltransferase